MRIVEQVAKQEKLLRRAGKEPVAVILSHAALKRMEKENAGILVFASQEKVDAIWGLPFQIDHEQKEDVRVLWE